MLRCHLGVLCPARRQFRGRCASLVRRCLLATATRCKLARYPERLCVLAAEVGGRWCADWQALVQRFVRPRARRAPAVLRHLAAQGWARRWWGALAAAVQRAMCGAVLGVWTMPPLPGAAEDILLADVLSLAADTAPSRQAPAVARRTCNVQWDRVG